MKTEIQKQIARGACVVLLKEVSVDGKRLKPGTFFRVKAVRYEAECVFVEICHEADAGNWFYASVGEEVAPVPDRPGRVMIFTSRFENNGKRVEIGALGVEGKREGTVTPIFLFGLCYPVYPHAGQLRFFCDRPAGF